MNKLLLSLAIALTVFSTQAQVVAIPDTNFLKALKRAGVDKNNDGQIQTSEAQAVSNLFACCSSISDLTGIQAFTNLDTLICFSNHLATMDLSKNTALINIDCSSNQLTTLDVSNNTALKDLDCESNLLTTLTVSGATALTNLWFNNNQLTMVDLSRNTSLKYLDCSSNQLTSLDVSNNIHLVNYYYDYLTSANAGGLKCNANSNLKQICINTSQLSDTSWWNPGKDATAKWSTACVTGLTDEQLQSAPKTLVGVYTPLGQPIDPKQATNGLFLYKYSDGSSRKIMIYE